MNSIVQHRREIGNTDTGYPRRDQADAQQSLLTTDQMRRLRDLLDTLSPSQILWTSGYLAGFARSPVDLIVDDGHPGITADTATTSRTLTILYGSETGNSRALAHALADRARGAGLSPNVVDMGEYKPRNLRNEQDLLVIASTYGEGDPPQQAAGFFDFIEGRKAPSLPDLRYAVLALGDSAYEHFCEAGKRLDRRFDELGAQRLHARVDCDIDYDEPALAWSIAVLAAIVPDDTLPASSGDVVFPQPAQPETRPLQPAASPQPQYSKRNPFPATIIENLVLTGRGSSKEIRHIELSTDNADLAFEPGDALGVMPKNDPSVVDAILVELSISRDQKVAVSGTEMTIAEALTQHLEITTATPRFLDHWTTLTRAPDLELLQNSAYTGQRAVFLHEHHIIDILRKYPLQVLDPQHFLAGLRPLQPRLYSIASSAAATPDEVHLTVATVRYLLHGMARSGVASGYLADSGKPEQTVPVYVQSNPHFRLPESDRSILMIGAGTGVAPYRAFLQERETQGAQGGSWLFFGERNFRTDFLYQTEWQSFMKDGVLTRMDVAFSRDTAAKDYVQHRLLDRARDVYAWLEEGAHLYVCGDAAHMAPDVHNALVTIVEQQGALSRPAAEDYMRGLQRANRYQRDVY